MNQHLNLTLQTIQFETKKVPIVRRWVSSCFAINKYQLVTSAHWENAVTGLLGEDRTMAGMFCVIK